MNKKRKKILEKNLLKAGYRENDEDGVLHENGENF